MKERILENWLDSSNERTFEVPFCFMLLSQGYTVIHMTRHSSMEMGKDIIAIDPQGVPCAFQLKSSPSRSITLTQWRTEIEPQVHDLMLGKIVHPSFPSSTPHRSYLVTNRDLNEEVQRAIDDLNRGWENRGHSEIRLETIVRGQLLKMALDHTPTLWPAELADVKILLELFLEDGPGPLPKAKVSHLLETTMGLHSNEVPSEAQLVRTAASSALLCALATSPWSRAENYAAEIEAWMIYIAALLAACERWGITQYEIHNSLEIAKNAIFRLLGKLCEELRTRSHLVEGNALADPPLLRVRVTQLIGLMSVYGLWQKIHGQQNKEHFEFVRDFCLTRGPQMVVWGEGAVPQFLAYYWFLKEIDASPNSDFMLMGLLKLIATQNGKQGPSLADPYQNAEDALLEALGFSEKEGKDSTEPSGVSYMAKGLLHLVAKRNWKQHLRGIWPDLTRLAFLEFEPAEPWQHYLWRSEYGTNVSEYPPLTKHWEDLRKEAIDCRDNSLPTILRQHPVLMLLFIMTYPHRATPEAVKWLDKMLRKF
ncbi:Uncharacterized [Moorella glycerini]|uniref:Uncharacterized protein n=1 Tax=Neomoorella stamsii TaxID=1266720 RepID=A0A9X7J271_9FIRM|nr:MULTISPECIES: hypothetical protein [Moorella]PRR71987.1 hypothetical protein MOST_21580 [Moorella stamsii]CEP66434.1 Uncharacterized [Moorella glycerini]